MASKTKSETKIVVLKGQEAEARVLEYMKIVILHTSLPPTG
jgi:hypothetical protein